MNIHSLYITRSKDEREYFSGLLGFMRRFSQNYKIVLIDFNWDDVITNIKFSEQRMVANVYTDSKDFSKVIYNFEDLVKLFEFKENGLSNAFVYSGHSNGVLLMKHNIRILRIEDFCELSFRTLKKKADVLIFDCCLCGNISVLNICYNYTNYIIAGSGYWSNLSILYTQSIHKKYNNIESFLKDSIKEFIQIEESTKKAFTTDIILYKMNKYVLEVIDIVKQYKFKKDGNYIIEKKYYKDLWCALKENIDIKSLLDKFILFRRFEVNKCHNKPKGYKTDYSWPSDLSIILKNPTKKE
jgi:hypothetical protein